MRNQIAGVLVTILYLQATAWTQGSGSITGVVRDATQSAIPGVSVEITNVQTGVSTTVLTNETGAYRVNSIPPGTYRIQATLPGFAPAIRDGVTLSTGQTLAVDLILQVGELNQSLEVVAIAELAESQSSTIGQLVDHKYIENLP